MELQVERAAVDGGRPVPLDRVVDLGPDGGGDHGSGRASRRGTGWDAHGTGAGHGSTVQVVREDRTLTTRNDFSRR